mgnify:CR=1 FL=1
MNEPVLEIRGLAISFTRNGITTTPVKNASLKINAGEILALVGESGSGKSLTAHAAMRLLPPTSHISGEIFFKV